MYPQSVNTRALLKESKGSDEKIRGKQNWPSNQIVQGFCRMTTREESEGYVYVEDTVKKGLIGKVYLYQSNNLEDESEIKLDPIVYYHSEESYVFLFNMNKKHWVITKISKTKLQDCIEYGTSMLNDKSTVYWINGIRSIMPTTLSDLDAESEWYVDDSKE